MNQAQAIDVQATVDGDLPGADEFAVHEVREALRCSPVPVGSTTVRLTRLCSAPVQWPLIAQVNVEVNGRRIRVQGRGSDVEEAVELVADRLRRRLERLSADHVQDRAGTRSEWARLPDTGDFYHRPVEEREVRREKSVVLQRLSVDEAVYELESMDYDFHLFVDAATGRDSVVSFPGDNYRLQQIGDDSEVPSLRLAEAKTWLDASGERFLFYLDPTLGRGCVLYRRYDGHYGLLQPDGGAR